MAYKSREFSIDLERDEQTQWGIRLVGGSDLNTPLIITKVTPGTPAQGQLLRGDIITKIQDYDARDIRNVDAQNLFRNAGNHIRLVIRRDCKLAVATNIQSPDIRPLTPCSLPPYQPEFNLLHVDFDDRAIQMLPKTDFQHITINGEHINGEHINGGRSESRASSRFSPMLTRDHQQEVAEETAAIATQPYRTTPLILPGAKVKKEFAPNESYLRHHPNPAMRGRAPHVDENFLRQRVADNVLNRVVGEDSRTGKVAHKQFNSPIGLYSDNNIEHTIRSTVPNTTPYKKTVVFDPMQSDTYRAIQEEQHFGGPRVHEIPITVQHQTYQPAAGAGKKPHVNFQSQPQNNNYNNVNAMGESADTIHQSHSFKRLMHSVLDDY